MKFYHIDCDFKYETSTFIVKAENYLHAIGKWLIAMKSCYKLDDNIVVLFRQISKIKCEGYVEGMVIELNDLIIYICISSEINESNPSYDYDTAVTYSYQYLPAKTRMNLTIEDVGYILELFYKFKDENGFVTNDDLLENSDNESEEELVFDANEVCPYVQKEAMREGFNYSLKNINYVFEAETEYLRAASILATTETNKIVENYELINMSDIFNN